MCDFVIFLKITNIFYFCMKENGTNIKHDSDWTIVTSSGRIKTCFNAMSYYGSTNGSDRTRCTDNTIHHNTNYPIPLLFPLYQSLRNGFAQLRRSVGTYVVQNIRGCYVQNSCWSEESTNGGNPHHVHGQKKNNVL